VAEPRVTDAHIHVGPMDRLHPAIREQFARGEGNAWQRMLSIAEDPDRMIAFLDEEGIERAVLIHYPAPEVMGFGDEVNDWVVRFSRAHPKRLIPVGGVHPRATGDPRGDVEKLVERGVRMLKIHPPHQLVAPNAYRDGGDAPALATIYETCQRLRLPVLIHTGTSVFKGARNKYADPLLVDDVAVDFPELTIVLAHGGRPFWMPQVFFLMRRFPNVHLDISGIPPKKLLEYFPRIEEIAGRTMFGSDWPSMGVESVRKNADDLRSLPISDAAKAAILGGTSERLLPT
jgi:predicted TIM-barrel fold metal-dependent hydrolase